ncbi:MAG: hypothetical protein AAFW83_00670 [Pseudomonadota bacterium]
MTNNQEFAALDAGLLARKGEAMPALSNATKTLTDTGLFAPVHPLTALRPAPQRARASSQAQHRSSSESPATEPAPVASPSQAAAAMTARISFRLPMDDYLRLKMATQLISKAGRDIMIDALSDYLDRHDVPDLGGCECLKMPASDERS